MKNSRATSKGGTKAFKVQQICLEKMKPLFSILQLLQMTILCLITFISNIQTLRQDNMSISRSNRTASIKSESKPCKTVEDG
ncbi:hypothetical protein HanHA300_Chr14g0508151 [Helianthus annuus]|nr:hypothetical protein HanHA300_Chr14g0508151 [Helianthus annuus]KAJ0484142.1 hypothetical protein HanHA89_Chr14g0540861 [Helianthus annuus]